MSRILAGVRVVVVEPAARTVIADRVERPRTPIGRGLGLMFRRELPRGHAMWIEPCNGIHMFWMRFAIDAVFFDRERRVVKVFRHLGRWRVVPLVLRARGVLELPAGALSGIELEPGDQLAFEGA